MTSLNCSHCDSSGRIEEIIEYKKTCWICSGRGWYIHLYEEEKVACKRCAGKGAKLYLFRGSRICPYCDGRGHVNID